MHTFLYKVSHLKSHLVHKPLLHHAPVHNVPQRFQMGGPTVLVIQVVRMLPDVEGEEGLEAVSDGVIGVGVLADGKGAVGIGLEPDPAGAEEANTFRFKFRLEGVEGTPLLLDLLVQRRFRGKPGMRCRRKLREIQVVIQDLAGVVEHPTGRSLHDFLQGFVL